MEIIIEKGIPIPPGYERNLKGLTKSLKAMEIGDSFEISAQYRDNIAAIARNAKVSIRSHVQRDNPAMLRVWRVAPRVKIQPKSGE